MCIEWTVIGSCATVIQCPRKSGWKLWTKVSDTQQLGAHCFCFNLAGTEVSWTGLNILQGYSTKWCSVIHKMYCSCRCNAVVVYILSCCTVHLVTFILWTIDWVISSCATLQFQVVYFFSSTDYDTYCNYWLLKIPNQNLIETEKSAESYHMPWVSVWVWKCDCLEK